MSAGGKASGGAVLALLPPPEEAPIPPLVPRSFCCPLGCSTQNRKKAKSRHVSTPAYTRKALAVP